MKKIKVLIVDDSASVRQTLTEILTEDPSIEEVREAADPYIAAQRIREWEPDVIVLDIEMPRMDGLTFLKKIMSQHPMRVVICSSLLSDKDSKIALEAIRCGAVETIYKPRMGSRQYIQESKVVICDVVKAAAFANLSKAKANILTVAPKLSADAMLPLGHQRHMSTTEKIVLVGASTGGTEALRMFLEAMPLTCPGIAIVQHMPEHFTRTFAERLNSLCNIEVAEARNGDRLMTGRALISPGDKHMLLVQRGTQYHVELKDGPLVSRHRPSVDVLFRSGARYAGQNALGIIMTGMGDDGARGMKEMHDTGSPTIAQDEESCVVFGMPNEAIKRGGVDKVVPLDQIPATMLKMVSAMK